MSPTIFNIAIAVPINKRQLNEDAISALSMNWD